MNHFDLAHNQLFYFSQKISKVANEIMQGQLVMMNRLTMSEKDKGPSPNYPPRSQLNNNRPPRKNQGVNDNRHPPQQSIPNTLSPSYMINQEGDRWCHYCNEEHGE